jgi:Putative  PD-(D/E)XK family member, (DUF4420)
MMWSSALAASLRESIAAVDAPLTDEDNDYRIATSVGPAFLARARSGAPTLLIPLDVAPVTVGRRGGGFSLTPASRVAFEYGGRRWDQAAAALECTEFQLFDAFLVLVMDISRRLALSASETTWPTILALVEEWQTLLARRAVLTVEQQLGLWGELWVISKAVNPDPLVAAWRGPEGEATDFFFDGIALEVKVSRRAHVHHVSQRQVEMPVGVHKAYLLSVWVGVEPVRGTSLAELVDTALARVSDAPALLKQVALLGYTPLDRDQYGTRFIPLDPPRWFRAEDVPRVRVIDPGISQVRYVVTLDIDRALAGELASGLWCHFCQAEPSVVGDPIGLS